MKTKSYPAIPLIMLMFVVLFSMRLEAQHIYDYTPLNDSLPFQTDIIDELKNICTKLCEETEKLEYPKKIKSSMREMYRQRMEEVSMNLEEGDYLYNPVLDAYLKSILAEIQQANPTIPSSGIRLFLSRSPEPNAVSLGEGTFLLNIGLLQRLENESQLAFVLCHEIAHYTLRHADTSIVERAITLNDSQTEKDLRKISRKTYDTKKRKLEYLKSLSYEMYRQSRKYEIEADELGVKYLNNTKYNAGEVLRALSILDSTDTEITHNMRLAEIFNSSEYPFKDSWLQEEDLIAFEHKIEDKDADSLKTHPDCKERMRLVQPHILQNYEKIYTADTLFNTLVAMSGFEVAETYYFYEDYGRCLYEAIKLLNKYPDNAYLYGLIGKCFAKIHENLKGHTLAGIVELPAQRQSASYRQLLQFIHNMRLSELANVNYYFLETRHEQFMNNEDFLFAWLNANEISGKEAEALQLRQRYEISFPKGKYIKELYKN